MRTPNGLAVPFTLAAVLALAAAWMPWVGSDDRSAYLALGSVFVDGWRSSLIGGHSFIFPNWTPAFLAVVLAFWAWMGAPRAALVWPAILYGFAHALYAANVLYSYGGGMIGAGVPLTFVAFAIFAVAAFRHRRESASPLRG